MEDVDKRRRNFLSLSKLECSPQEINSIMPTLEIFSAKTEKKTLIHFKSDVFNAVAVVDAKTPYCFCLRVRVGERVCRVVSYLKGKHDVPDLIVASSFLPAILPFLRGKRQSTRTGKLLYCLLTCRGRDLSIEPCLQNEHDWVKEKGGKRPKNHVKLTRKFWWNSCSTTRLHFVPSNPTQCHLAPAVSFETVKFRK